MYRKYLLEPIPESSSKWNNSPLKICTSCNMVTASLQISLRLSIQMLRLSSITRVRQINSQKSIHGWENRPIFFNTDAKSKTCTYQLWNTISLWKNTWHSYHVSFCTLTTHEQSFMEAAIYSVIKLTGWRSYLG